MGNTMPEKEINLWDMFWAICLKWRMICLAAIVATIIAGLISYYKSIQAFNAQNNVHYIQNDELIPEDQANAKRYIECLKSYEQLTMYVYNSPLMQLDANGFFAGTLSYCIQNQHDVTTEKSIFIEAYREVLGNEYFRDKIVQTLNITTEEQQAFAVEYVDVCNYYGNKNYDANVQDNILRISVYANDLESCQTLLELVKAALIQEKEYVVRCFGEHDIVCIGETCGLIADSNLLSFQTEKMVDLYAQGTRMDTVYKLLSEQGKNYVNQILDENKTPDVTDGDSAIQAIGGISYKMMAAGFVLGAFATIIVIAFKYLLNDKLIFEDDFEEIYKIRLFGRIYKEEKKSIFGSIDNIFLKLRRKKIRCLEQNELIDMIYTNIKLSAQKDEITSIYFMGTGYDKVDNLVLMQIITKLKKSNIKVKLGKSVLYYSDAMEELSEMGSAVLLEQSGSSLYHEILEEVELCRLQKINVLGAIMIE